MSPGILETGVVVDLTGEYASAFVLAAAISLVCGRQLGLVVSQVVPTQ